MRVHSKRLGFPRVRQICVLGLSAGLLLSAQAVAQVYKWVDHEGVTHYSESPPPAGSARASTLNVPVDGPHYKATDPADPQSWQSKQREMEERAAQAADAKKKDEEKAEKEAALRHRECLKAQSDADRLNRPIRLYNVNEQGERVYLSDAERAQALQSAANRVAEYCSS